MRATNQAPSLVAGSSIIFRVFHEIQSTKFNEQFVDTMTVTPSVDKTKFPRTIINKLGGFSVGFFVTNSEGSLSFEKFVLVPTLNLFLSQLHFLYSQECYGCQ